MAAGRPVPGPPPPPPPLAPRAQHGTGLTPLFDHHIHTDLRNADDYELMAVSGVLTALAPCSASLETRASGDAFAARFERLAVAETGRAAAYGIDLHVALAVHAADMAGLPGALAGIEALEGFLDHPKVRALGELSLRGGGPDEVEVLERQLKLASARGLPVLVESPPALPAFRELLAPLAGAVERAGIDPASIALLDLDEARIDLLAEHPALRGLGRYGIAVAPRQDALFQIREKQSHREVLRLLERFGPQRLMLNTGLHFGSADPLGLARTVHRLRLHGVPEQIVRALAHDNAAEFFAVPHRLPAH
ncbi:deoxyribonuclease [Kitasatospora aureofaciens]|uniref:deoxyribonuclease n=1 Tax=Kitasatospora aureofaciens TaxID=1894 RepID=UPI001C4942FE|nr:deoxyribonuclease [Kitasatospora aureofaciens]MBV6702046.1 deoxyribonuclease [Kitasatospora aureofaciens]